MLKGLLAMDENLAGSIALHYASQLALDLPLRLQIGHVEMPDKKPHSSGTGWIRRSWEQGVKNAARQAIYSALYKEKAACPLIGIPKIFIGDHDDEYLLELQRGHYDLFIEGRPDTSDLHKFHNLLTSPLFSQAPCPLMVVKNPVQGKTICLLCNDGFGFREMFCKMARLLKSDALRFTPVFYRYQETDPIIVENDLESGPVLGEAKELLTQLGLRAEKGLVITGTPKKTANFLKKYSLIATSFPPGRSPTQDLLAHSPLPLLLWKTNKECLS